MRCPRWSVTAWPSALMAEMPLPSVSLPIPATRVRAGNRNMEQTLKPQPYPFLYQIGMPREEEALPEVT